MMKLNNQVQGSLDGMCGMYAITNAISVACGIGNPDDVFQAACNGLAKTRWPHVLWEGTTFRDIQTMTRNCITVLNLDQIKVRYPFQVNTPRTNDEYWARFDELFDDEVRCAIMGVTHPSAHWIVAGYEGGRIQFLDSEAGGEFKRKNRASLFAGERKQKASQWLLDRKELVLFSVS